MLHSSNAIFENLFVLELANNHWGKLERGLRIIKEFATIVRYNNVRASIKLQFRDVDSFIHNSFKVILSLVILKKQRQQNFLENILQIGVLRKLIYIL